MFFALWPEAPLVKALAAAAAEGARAFGGRATRPDTLHLTLAFIGDVALDRLPALRAAAEAAAAPAFALTVDRLGYWGHNRILWAGGEAEPALTGLVRALGRELEAAGFAGAGGGRPFAPHVTLVRNLRRAPAELPAFPPRRWECREFLLVRSRLSTAGAAYEPLGRWPLG